MIFPPQTPGLKQDKLNPGMTLFKTLKIVEFSNFA